MIAVVIPIVIATGLVCLFRFANTKHNPPIFGVYQRRNKYFWFKFVFMYIVLRLQQVHSTHETEQLFPRNMSPKTKKKFLYVHVRGLLAVELGYSYDGTVHIHEDDVALEQKYSLGDGLKAVDAVYFNGTAKDGVAIITGVARRPQNYVDAFMYLKVNNEDLLLSPDLPETRIKQSPEEEGNYRVGSIHLSNVIPMRTWKVAYDGEMKFRSNPEKRVKVRMDLTWSALYPAFNYNHHMSPLSLAKDMARERWSPDYFKLLKKFHQTHYEQMGYLTGSVFVDDKQHAINMPCVRDHTFGKIREWRSYHRYVLHFIFLENGDCMEIGSVSQPVVFSHVTIGYLCRKSDQAVLPVKACDFQLWHHGENQILPKDYGFTFKAGGKRYDVRIQVNDEDHFYIGKLNDTKIYERWATVEVNGVKGWGCLEWQYNNTPAAMKQH